MVGGCFTRDDFLTMLVQKFPDRRMTNRNYIATLGIACCPTIRSLRKTSRDVGHGTESPVEFE